MKVLFVHKASDKKNAVERTVIDCVDSFKNYSVHRYNFITYEEINKYINHLSNYDAICLYKFHFTLEKYLSLDQKIKIKNYKGCKIIFLEEEYFILHERLHNIWFLEVDYVFSAAPKGFIDTIYFKYPQLLHKTKIVKVFHGYVDNYMLQASYIPFHERKIDVSYRALKLPAFYGRLGLEKNLIGELFVRNSLEYNLKLDISNDIHKRLWGNDWHNLLRNSKAVLGVEASSGVIDFGRKIFDSSIEYEENNVNAAFEKIEKIYFNGLDGIHDARVISPRHFEYAAFKCLMILFEGRYEDILEPWRHYVPLKKDFSNTKEIIAVLRNEEKALEITECAYKEIAINPKYHFKEYINQFDSVIFEYYSQTKKISESVIFPDVMYDKVYVSKEKTLYLQIKNILDKNINRKSIVYKLMQKSNKLFKNTYRLWAMAYKHSKNIFSAFFWFVTLFHKSNDLVKILCILEHLQQREKVLGVNIIGIRNTKRYCTVECNYGDPKLINFKEFVDIFTEIKQKYVFFRFADSWHLHEEFRDDFIVSLNSHAYKFLYKLK